jgi:preprotein translocase subunit SecB
MAKKKKAASVPADLTKVASAASIGQLRMIEGVCSLGPGKPPDELAQTMHIATNRVAENAIMATGLYLLHEKDKSPDAEGFRVCAEFTVVFKFQDMKTLKSSDVVQFCLKVGATTLWPYWREYVQSQTTRMGLPGLRIPLLHPKTMRAATKKELANHMAKPKPGAKKKMKLK